LTFFVPYRPFLKKPGSAGISRLFERRIQQAQQRLLQNKAAHPNARPHGSLLRRQRILQADQMFKIGHLLSEIGHFHHRKTTQLPDKQAPKFMACILAYRTDCDGHTKKV
jgi:hypothetical protein